MVDKIVINKIQNGFTTSCDWNSLYDKSTIYHKDMPDVLRYLDNCFVIKKENVEKRV